MEILIGLLWWFSLIGFVLAGEYCYKDGSHYEYCAYDCCGSWPYEECCGVYTWAISLAVIGAILTIAFIVVLVCCWYKKKGRQGRVINATSQPTTTITTVYGQQPQYGYMGPPPGYQPAGFQPAPGYQPQPGFQPAQPAFGQSSMYPPPSAPQSADPAFPPPAPAKY